MVSDQSPPPGTDCLAHGVLVFGNLVVDTLAGPLRENPRWNATIWVDRLEQQIGGNGANTAYTLATLGVPARLVGFVGNDAFGEFLRERLRAAGVDVTGVQVTDAASPVTVALVHENGSRAFLHRPGASATAFEELPELTAHLVAGCSAFHLANPFAIPESAPARSGGARAREGCRSHNLDGYRVGFARRMDAGNRALSSFR